MKSKHLILPLLLAANTLFASNTISEENKVVKTDSVKYHWQHYDLAQDGIPGISANKAYKEVLKGKKSKKVIVAIIDSGVDIKHEDLKGLIWTNKDEIPNNGKDDDNNGYIDDINGWNYLGNANGKNVTVENLEITRLYKQYKELAKSDKSFTSEEKKALKTYKKEYFAVYKANKKSEKATTKLFTEAKKANTLILAHLNKDKYEEADLKTITTSTDNKKLAKAAQFFLDNRKLSYYEWKVEFLASIYDTYLNLDLNARAIVGDNPNDINDTDYGNNNVIATGADHGTHVAGIIGANRNNTLGMRGIADNVEFMTLRCVPDGDERDKDVARAIRYAVDNGAQVMNMSFGKNFASNQKAVESAIKYAEAKGVIMMIAAGNDSKNVEVKNSFPKTKYMSGTTPNNVLYVGASSAKNDKALPAIFSNYGPNTVDVFSPGVKIYSTTPDNEYRMMSGTSMATPVAAGAAAVLLSYYPELSAADVVSIIKKSATSHKNQIVTLPNKKRDLNGKQVPFSSLSRTGAVVNLYEACKLAEQKINAQSKR